MLLEKLKNFENICVYNVTQLSIVQDNPEKISILLPFLCICDKYEVKMKMLMICFYNHV